MTAHQASPPLTDLELLEIQAEMSMDDRRRLAGTCGVTIAATSDGQALFVGSEIADTLVPALVDAVDKAPLASAPDREPPGLVTCREILASSCGPLSLHASPYYVIEPHVRVETRTPIARSDASPGERLRHLNPGNWAHDKWDELLDGALGPWAMAVVDGRVVSICHTPRPMTERAAECGVWTHPDYRGRGYAAEVTAAWADVLRPSGRYLFYSTDAQNLSSQRVAARLQLRPIGWTWNLTRANRGPRDRRHPLSRRSS
jgi:RimJ/RimL family protein N-acetyltransferase